MKDFLLAGGLGLLIIFILAVLSGITTLLELHYFLRQLYPKQSVNKNIMIYLVLIIVAGTFAVFGFDIIFDVVDILMFAVCGLNVTALTIVLAKNRRKKAAANYI